MTAVRCHAPRPSIKRQRTVAAPRYSLGGCLTPRDSRSRPHSNFQRTVAPAFIACLRLHSLTSEYSCARERAARLDLLREAPRRLHTVSASICPASTTPPAGVHAPRSSSGPAPLASSSTLYSPDRTHRSFGPSSPPSSSICRAVCRRAQGHLKCHPRRV